MMRAMSLKPVMAVIREILWFLCLSIIKALTQIKYNKNNEIPWSIESESRGEHIEVEEEDRIGINAAMIII